MAANQSEAATASPMGDLISEQPLKDQEVASPVDDGLDALVMGDSNAIASDDLTKIEGIGPKIAELLNAGGISSFAQLAATPADQVKSLLVAGGGSFAVHDPTTWPQQAQMAAAGQWEQLQQWQDELDGGRA
jgi:DNA-directed RNA polymerase subunit beta'